MNKTHWIDKQLVQQAKEKEVARVARNVATMLISMLRISRDGNDVIGLMGDFSARSNSQAVEMWVRAQLAEGVELISYSKGVESLAEKLIKDLRVSLALFDDSV